MGFVQVENLASSRTARKVKAGICYLSFKLLVQLCPLTRVATCLRRSKQLSKVYHILLPANNGLIGKYCAVAMTELVTLKILYLHRLKS